MTHNIPFKVLEQVKAELNLLESETIEVDGLQLKPSQCYHLGMDPAHVLFNTNCPDMLKERVSAILTKYAADHESGS